MTFPAPTHLLSVAPPPTLRPVLRLDFLGRTEGTLDAEPVRLRRRFCEILVILALNPSGVSSAKLCSELYGEWIEIQNQGLEIHRLSKLVPISSRPYRVGVCLSADFLDVQEQLMHGQVEAAIRAYTGELLPLSDAPAVSDLRECLHESVRQAVLQSGSLPLLWLFCSRFPDELEPWEQLAHLLEPHDPRLSLVQAKIKVIARRHRLS
ncbi:hypothetical protein [Deinococcus aquatilis]|uniref:hypothetical protein n=1 Tax=Deinococcus aquatilis TaxID=519440 RepID=UPI0003636F2D|nr:hypothetical protein [Deinococcus aquatilis]